MPQITALSPHIVVRGADAAASWYGRAFGAEEIARIPVPDGRLMSVQLRIGAATLHVADEFPELEVLSPLSLSGTATVLQLETSDAQALWKQALEAGAEPLQPLQEAFWGELHGQLADPYGHKWNVAQHVRDVEQAEVVRQAAALFGG
jgi:PhnB protein